MLLLQMLGKEVEAARPGEISAVLVVAWPLVATKTMLRTRINIDIDVGPFGLDGIDVAERNAVVLFAEMKLGRHCGLVVGETNHSAAVIADRSR